MVWLLELLFSSLAFRVSFFGLASRAIIFSVAFRVSFLVWLPELLFSSLAFRVSFLVWLPELLFSWFKCLEVVFGLASRAFIFCLSV